MNVNVVKTNCPYFQMIRVIQKGREVDRISELTRCGMSVNVSQVLSGSRFLGLLGASGQLLISREY
jgi:hypothetical protein